MTFKENILQGIPTELPVKKEYPKEANRAPKRKDILSNKEKQLAIRNALRYFPKKWHEELAAEFADELQRFGRIY
ncbi:urocanate hydratase, partial [Tenacibaculum maritimum]|nr:urocanate hydratase [Tenacibaculum maritimum]